MNSGLRSLTHHIFFPPRPEVVVAKENSNCLSSNGLCDLVPNRFDDDQLDRPPGIAFGRIRADHGHDLRVLSVRKQSRSAFAGTFVKCSLQPALLISATHSANGCLAGTGRRGNIDRCPALIEEEQNAGPFEYLRSDLAARR